MIEFYNSNQCHKVTKPWGHELWLQSGSTVYPFVLKQLQLQAGNRTSLQVHRFKSESIIILSGTGLLLTTDTEFDCAKYIIGGMHKEEVDAILNTMYSYELSPNNVFHTPPGTIHRMIAHTDLLYIEASTQELDDVIRLQDDLNRTHGKIDAEHK